MNYGKFPYLLERRPSCNTGLAKVAVTCSADSIAVLETLISALNFCYNSPPSQAQKPL